MLHTIESSQRDTAARSCKKLIRFNPEELAVVSERARAAGQPVACYIRDVSLGARKKPSNTARLAESVIRDLSRVATRLCTLREAAKARGLPEAPEFATAVEDILALIRQVD